MSPILARLHCAHLCVCVYIIMLAHGYILKILNERIKYFTTRIELVNSR